MSASERLARRVFYAVYDWVNDNRPVTHRKAFWDAEREGWYSDFERFLRLSEKALEALETKGEDGIVAARGHLYAILYP